MTTTYSHDYQQSLAAPEDFWAEQAKLLAWKKFPQQILSQNERGFYRWYADGELNTAHLALDFHVEQGRGEQAALIYDSPVTQQKQSFTYRELRDEVALFAGVLQSKGVEKGDRVIIYMPMIPQTLIAMLACARLGAIHSVVFGGFAAHELAIRIDDAQPKLILTATCGIEVQRIVPYLPIVKAAIAEAEHKPEAAIVYQRPQLPDQLEGSPSFDWDKLRAVATPAPITWVKAGDPLYILYTSGTTGKPKGIVRDHGGHAVALKYSMDMIYGVKPGEVYWAASDVGWVVGHSYIVYGPLLHGCTTVMFEGKPIKTPDPGTFWRVIGEHKVNVFFTAPTAIRAIRKEDPQAEYKKQYPTPSLRALFLAGERCDVSTYEWVKSVLEVPVIDHWWQTESGWPMIANMTGYGFDKTKPGSAGKAVCGFDIRALSGNAAIQGPNQEGAICIKLPLPPSCLPTLWRNDDRFERGYLSRFPGWYLSGDGGYVDEDGYIFITGRIDDVINVAGHRLSTAEMEEVIAAHPAVAECAVIGVADELRGQVPIGLVVLQEGVRITEETIAKELIQSVRETVGPVAYFKKVFVADRLPKTRSGKILRKIMRCIADRAPYSPPSTIENPVVLDEIKALLLAPS
ncbi:MAG: propionyl-CoA synthetase [Bacteroidota bacterium]